MIHGGASPIENDESVCVSVAALVDKGSLRKVMNAQRYAAASGKTEGFWSFHWRQQRNMIHQLIYRRLAFFARAADLDKPNNVEHRGVVASLYPEKASILHLVPAVDRQVLEIGLAPKEFLAVEQAADGVAADLHIGRVDRVGFEKPGGFPLSGRFGQ